MTNPGAVVRPAVVPGAMWQFAAVATLHLGVLQVLLHVVLPAAGGKGHELAVAVFLGTTAVTALALFRSYPHRDLGLCNVVTHLRATLMAGLSAALLVPQAIASADLAWTVVGIAAVALALDGVDGWLARRRGLVSRFGARFDMEIDAGLALILAALILLGGKAGAWVLILGLARYAFVAAGALLPWLRAPLPERFRRKAICVLQLGALIVLQAPVVTPPWSDVLAAAACGLVLWSFAIDLLWLHGRRAVARAPA